MRSDLERWNQKYGDANPNPDFSPDSILETYAPLLDGVGIALDVACGVGHNAMKLARLGYYVLALDGSLTALRRGRHALVDDNRRIGWVNADLDRFFLPADTFDVVLVIRYLNRPFIGQLKTALRPGGLLIYKTFNVNYLDERPVFNKAYLLGLGELAALFADFSMIESNDTLALTESQSYWVGRRPR
jgi:SAM-dependent methyltransferase